MRGKDIQSAFLERGTSASTVKDLKWKAYRNGDAEAIGPFGVIYTAYANGHWRTNLSPKFKKGGDDLTEAKRAAQNDCAAVIGEWIVTTG